VDKIYCKQIFCSYTQVVDKIVNKSVLFLEKTP